MKRDDIISRTPKFDEFRFVDSPKLQRLNDYSRAVEEASALLRNGPDVVGVGQLGSVSSPGISDIDLLIIVRDHPRKPKETRRAIHNCYVRLREFTGHYPLIIPEALAPKIPVLYPTFDVRLIWGVPVKLPDKRNRWLDLVFLVDFINLWCFFYFIDKLIKRRKAWNSNRLQTIGEILFSSKGSFKAPLWLDVRNVLCNIYSMKYTIQLFENVTGQSIRGWGPVYKRICAIRKEWFMRKKEEGLMDLVELLIDCAKISLQLVGQTANVLYDRGWGITGVDREQLRETGGVAVPMAHGINLYKEQWSARTAWNDAYEWYNKTGNIVTVLPLVFTTQLLYWPRVHDIMNAQKRKMLLNMGLRIEELEYRESLVEHYNLIMEQCALLDRLKLNQGEFMSLSYPFRRKDGKYWFMFFSRETRYWRFRRAENSKSAQSFSLSRR